MLTAAWTPLRYHELQSQLWRSKARFISAACGRGSGKTELARRRVIRMLPIKKQWPRPMYFYALPTYKQARRVAWQNLIDLIPPDWVKKIHHSNMLIDTVWGSQLYVLGLDKPERIEGDQWDGGVIDESCDQKPGVFDRSVLPALSHKNGWCWRIGVPKRTGPGAKEFKLFFDSGKMGTDNEAYTWSSDTVLTQEQLKFARENLNERDYNEQYNASWESVSGLIFHAFDEVLNVRATVTYDPSLPLLIGSDFNVDPMAWIISQKVGEEVWVLDELFIRGTNTGDTLKELAKRYGEHKGGFDFFGDATGRSRNTRASESDYIQIRNSKLFSGARVFYPRSNPIRANRFSACNTAFCSADGRRRVLIHPRCVNLIRDLTTRAYKEGTSDPDDYGDVGHITDALGYMIVKVLPLRPVLQVTSPTVHLTDF